MLLRAGGWSVAYKRQSCRHVDEATMLQPLGKTRMACTAKGAQRLQGGPTRHLCRSIDYTANMSDEGVLRLPGRTELEPEEITNVFGYPRDFPEKYFIGKVLGCGSFGIVRECLERSTERRYAVKTIEKIPKRGPPTPRYLLKMRAEVEIMQQLGYSLDAVNLKDVFEDDECIHMVMQLCEGGALLERIESNRYSEKYIARLVRSILRFISQCHAKGFIYRDVKPDNFLFLTREPESPLKATDFGLSIKHWPDEPRLSSRSGTPAYMAPELILQSYDEKCDIWSIGIMTYQLLTGRFPYWEDVRNESLTDVWKAILSKDINWNAPELKELSGSAVDFLRSLMKRDPANRPSASAALEHRWVKEQGSAEDLPLKGSVVQRLQRFSTYGHLKQMVLKMIVDKMRGSTTAAAGGGKTQNKDKDSGSHHIKGLQELFQDIDTDGSGGISLTELSEGLRRQGYVLSDSELEQLGRKMDFDSNDNIDLTEFMTTLIDWGTVQSEQKWQTYLDDAFELLDHDGNGFISLDELMIQLSHVHATVDGSHDDADVAEEAKQMLREADINGDGQISREEFYDLLKDNHAQDTLSLYDDRLHVHMGGWKGSGERQSVGGRSV